MMQSSSRTSSPPMRGTGLRIGELRDLELDCIIDYGPAGSWLRVPLGKLNTERAVPLDQPTLDVLDGWLARRRRQRPLPHPRDGRLADFVFVERGRHLGPTRLSTGLRPAILAPGLAGSDGRAGGQDGAAHTGARPLGGEVAAAFDEYEVGQAPVAG